MSYELNDSILNGSLLSNPIVFSYSIRFWIILPFHIPSLICSIFAFSYLIFHQALRQALHNHIIILLLFINILIQLVHIPSVLNYYRLEHVWPTSSYFCMIWIVADEGLRITTTLLFAWAALERHILIFHDRLVTTKKKIIIFHYMPMTILLMYCFCYCIIIILFPPCENTYNYTEVVCGSPLCYYDIRFLTLWDMIVNDIISTLIITVFSISLLIRIICQKSRMRQRIHWRKYRRMTIQLLSISTLFLGIYVPHVLIQFVQFFGINHVLSEDLVLYGDFLVFYGNLLLPFVCVSSMTELRTKLKKMIPCRQRQSPVVRPLN